MSDFNVACDGPSGDCKFSGPLSEWPPNMTSFHNAVRCPECGSTRNDYNAEHSRQISAVMSGKQKGPVTTETVIAALKESA